MMCLGYVNDNHFMMIYLKDCCQIPSTSLLWKQQIREDVKSWDEIYIKRMIACNELCCAACYEVIGDDDLYLVENLDPEENVDDDKNVEDGVKIEKDESLELDDCSIDLRAD
jgi:hypothetical protein